MDIYEINKQFEKGNIYFKCASDKTYVLRIENETSEFYIKVNGMAEFKVKQGSSLLTDALLQIEFITEKEYNDFK